MRECLYIRDRTHVSLIHTHHNVGNIFLAINNKKKHFDLHARVRGLSPDNILKHIVYLFAVSISIQFPLCFLCGISLLSLEMSLSRVWTPLGRVFFDKFQVVQSVIFISILLVVESYSSHNNRKPFPNNKMVSKKQTKFID